MKHKLTFDPIRYVLEDVYEIDKEALADLRVSAMKESLQTIGRFDPHRARSRFLEDFSAADTQKIMIDELLAGFYVTKVQSDHIHLQHLYIHPNFQDKGLGKCILKLVKEKSRVLNLPVRLLALRKSRSNNFYTKNGFFQTHEGKWDIYYEYNHQIEDGTQ